MPSRCESSGYPADARPGEKVTCPSCDRPVDVGTDSFGTFLVEHEEPLLTDPESEGSIPPGHDWVRAFPAEAVRVLLEAGALEQVGWRFQAKRPSDPGYRYGFMTYIPGEAGHHDHEPVYRLAPTEGDAT